MTALKKQHSKQNHQNSDNADRLGLLQGLVNLYCGQKSGHNETAQQQFCALLCAYWADVPAEIKNEWAQKLATRKDISIALNTLIKECKTQKSVKSVQKETKSKALQNVKVLKSAAKYHIPVWWSQTELFFDMKIDARVKAIADLAHADVEQFNLPNLPEKELRDVKNFYFAGNIKEVLDVLQKTLNISNDVFNYAMADKSLIGLCILLKSLGFNSKDMTSFIIFNSAKLDQPANDAFTRAKWIDSIPNSILAKIIQLWQNSPIEHTLIEEGVSAPALKSNQKAKKSGALVLQDKVKSAIKKQVPKVEKLIVDVKNTKKVAHNSTQKKADTKINVKKISTEPVENTKVDIEAQKSKSLKEPENKAYFIKPIRVNVSYKKS